LAQALVKAPQQCSPQATTTLAQGVSEGVECPFCRSTLSLPNSIHSAGTLVVACHQCEANVLVLSNGSNETHGERTGRIKNGSSHSERRIRRSGLFVSIAFCLLSYFFLILLGAWGFEEIKKRYDPYNIDEHIYSSFILESQGWTKLHLAAARGDVDGVRRFSSEPALVNSRNQLGRTPLYEAAKRGQLTAMTILIEKGADLEAKGKFGFTPIFPAIQRGHLKAVELLIDRGAQVNGRCDCGATTLYEAVKWGREDVAQYLVQRGALVNAKVNGQTALAYAEEHDMEEMADILRQLGGKTFKDSEQLVDQGAEFFKQGQWDRSLELYNKAVELDPESVPAYSHRAATWIKKQEFDRALVDYRRILQLTPTHADTHMNISWIYAQRQQWDLGIELWSNLIKLQPNNGKAYFERAHHAWSKKDSVLAREDLHHSCSLGYAEGCTMFKSLGDQTAP